MLELSVAQFKHRHFSETSLNRVEGGCEVTGLGFNLSDVEVRSVNFGNFINGVEIPWAKRVDSSINKEGGSSLTFESKYPICYFQLHKIVL